MKKLTLIDKVFLLKRTPLFQTLSLDLLLPIADQLHLVSFAPHEDIFTFAEEASRMYFITEGEVQIFARGGQVVALLGVGECFGDEALFYQQARAYAARSLGETQLLILSRTALHAIISECPSVAVGLLRVYAASTPCRHIRFEERGEMIISST